MKIYHFNTELTEGRYSGKTVQEVFDSHPDFIFKTLKKWAANKAFDNAFDDEVLSAAHINKLEHEHKFYQDNKLVDKDVTEKQLKLKKENKSVDDIVYEMDNERYNYSKYDKDDDKSIKASDDLYDTDMNDGFTIIEEENK